MSKFFSKRHLRRYYYKVVRQEGTPESIARAMALGLFVGFLIPIGAQTIVVIPLAFLLKANKLLSFVFTCITNPYTVFFIYPAQCYLGSLLLFEPMSFHEVSKQFQGLIQDPSWDSLKMLGSGVLLPFFVGGAFLGCISIPIGYYTGLGMVHGYRKRREARLRRRLAARVETATVVMKGKADEFRKLEK